MIMLDKYLFDRKDAFDSYMSDPSHTLIEAETEILGFDHSEIGSDVCKKWGLPPELTSAIRYHHDPSRSSNSELAYLIYIADKISFVLETETDNEKPPLDIEPEILEMTGISEDDLDKIMEEMKQSVEKMTKRVFS
jgi:HD-like signal output (HDOD) protein